VIAEILAWSEDEEKVERIIRRYVARTAATKEASGNSMTQENRLSLYAASGFLW
jgi:hypothetical protein